MNAREFVIALAEQLTEQGRDVEIKEDDRMIFIFSNSRSILETAVAASAYKSSVTGRWNFQGVSAWPLTGPEVREQTRRNAEIVVSVYGRSHVRKVVSA